MKINRENKSNTDKKTSPAMDHKNPRKMATHHPAPYQSPLGAHLDLIRSMRRARKTWQEIAKQIGDIQGKPIHPSTVFNFFKRYVDRLERNRQKGRAGGQPLGYEPLPGEPDYPGSSDTLSVPTGPAQPAGQ